MDGSQYGVGEPGPATPDAPNRKASGAKRAAMDPAGAISGRMTARIVRLLEARGRDPAVLCAASGTSVEEVISPSARIPYRVADALLEACAEELGRDGLSLALAAVYDEDTYDAAALVLLTSPTFGQGLERALAFQRLWADGERFTLLPSSDSDDVVVRFRHPGQSVVARAVLGELALLETMTAARLLVDAEARARAVRFSHSPSGDPSALAAAFGVAPQFEAHDNELVLPGAIVRASIRAPRDLVAHAIEQLAHRAISALPEASSLSARVRALCGEDPGTFNLNVAEVARRVRVSPRTLQRRLRAEGTSWADIVDALRRSRAKELSRRGLSAKEIAYVLGFADPGALARARERWRRQGSA